MRAAFLMSAASLLLRLLSLKHVSFLFRVPDISALRGVLPDKLVDGGKYEITIKAGQEVTLDDRITFNADFFNNDYII